MTARSRAPGYYAVTLTDPGVRAEMTAGTRIGVHRYTFAKDKAAHLVFDLRTSLYNYPGKVSWSSIRLRPDGTLTGGRETRGWAPGRKLFFAMRFSRPLVGHDFAESRDRRAVSRASRGRGARGSDIAELKGRALVARLDFGRIDAPLEVKVGISTVDEDGAVANLASEPGDFDAIRAQDRARLGQGAVGARRPGRARRCSARVYTALYHSLMAPSVLSDADGRYRGPDDQIHTRRRLHLPLDLFAVGHVPRRASAAHHRPAAIDDQRRRPLARSPAARQSPYGILPVWQFQGQETWTMIGYHAVPGHRRRLSEGHPRVRREQGARRDGRERDLCAVWRARRLHELGYVPIDREPEAASKTVEYAYDDWTIARMARKMGRMDVAATFEKRAAYWRNSFDAKTGWLRARKADGSFRVPFDPTAINYGSDYTEGNAWQYSWFVPQDQGGLFRCSAATRRPSRSSTRCSISTIPSSITAMPRISPG